MIYLVKAVKKKTQNSTIFDTKKPSERILINTHFLGYKNIQAKWKYFLLQELSIPGSTRRCPAIVDMRPCNLASSTVLYNHGSIPL